MLLVVMLSVVCLPICLSACLSVHQISICHLTSPVRSISSSPVKAFCNFLILMNAEFIVITKSVKERHGHTFKVQDMVRRSAEKKNYKSTFTSDVAVPICSLHKERSNPLHISLTKCRFFCERLTECSPY